MPPQLFDAESPVRSARLAHDERGRFWYKCYTNCCFYRLHTYITVDRLRCRSRLAWLKSIHLDARRDCSNERRRNCSG